MIRQSIRFSKLSIDQGRFNKTLDRQMLDLIEVAATEMLREMIKVIPVDTGMAQGSLVPLRRILRDYVDLPDKIIRRHVRVKQGADYPGGVKSFWSGIGMGDASRPKNRAPGSQNPTYSFFVRTDVPHFRKRWDTYPVGPFDLARDVFRRVVRERIRAAVPRMRDFVVIRELVDDGD